MQNSQLASVRFQLPLGEVHLWQICLSLPDSILGEMSRCLSADERARAVRFRFEGDRRTFIAAHSILRQILALYLGLSPERIELVKGRSGKPEITLASRCMPLFFNLAHSGTLALIGVNRGGEIGVDVEKIRPFPALSEIAHRYFTAREWATLENLDAAVREVAFFRCWTRKEAFVKAYGDGLLFGLDCFEVTAAPGEPARLLWAAGQAEAGQRWWMTDIEPEAGYVGACVVERPVFRVRMWEWALVGDSRSSSYSPRISEITSPLRDSSLTT
jgi:4'-phosphopantetheinyl transferase